MGIYKKINNKKYLIFRISLEKKSGLGHFIRCFKIFQEVKKKYNCIFVVDRVPKILKNKYNNITFFEIYRNNIFTSQNSDIKKFLTVTKNLKPHILIVDDYRLNSFWHKKARIKSLKIIVIDDLSNRYMYCDYYINYKINIEKRYNQIKKINKRNTKFILGTNYTIISKDLKRKSISKSKKNIIINFGNSFNFAKIKKNFKELLKLNHNIYVCIGVFASNYEFIINLSKKNKNIKILHNKISIDKITSKMDLFIGSAGNAIYENSYLRLPSIFFSLTHNQENEVNDLKILGHQFFLKGNELTNYRIIVLIKLVIKNIDKIKRSYQNINKIKKLNIKNLVKEIKL